MILVAVVELILAISRYSVDSDYGRFRHPREESGLHRMRDCLIY